MPVPDYQTLMLPVLQVMADGGAKASREIREAVARRIALSAEDRQELLPSGTQAVFDNRVAWGLVYLQRAGLLDRVQRGVYRLADRGRETLDAPPEQITIKWLEQFPEFAEWRKRSKAPQRRRRVARLGGKPKSVAEPAADEPESSQTPVEALEAAYEQLRAELTTQILEQVKKSSPAFFERLVVDLLLKMGYGGSRRDAGQAIGRPGDEGIDGLIKEDRLGLDVIYLQAKKWEGTVSRPELQKFVGALHGKHAKKGVLITTSTFSEGARRYAETIDSQVILIDGEFLAELMVEHGLGVTVVDTYEISRLDTDYFDED